MPSESVLFHAIDGSSAALAVQTAPILVDISLSPILIISACQQRDTEAPSLTSLSTTRIESRMELDECLSDIKEYYKLDPPVVFVTSLSKIPLSAIRRAFPTCIVKIPVYYLVRRILIGTTLNAAQMKHCLNYLKKHFLFELTGAGEDTMEIMDEDHAANLKTILAVILAVREFWTHFGLFTHCRKQGTTLLFDMLWGSTQYAAYEAEWSSIFERKRSWHAVAIYKRHKPRLTDLPSSKEAVEAWSKAWKSHARGEEPSTRCKCTARTKFKCGPCIGAFLKYHTSSTEDHKIGEPAWWERDDVFQLAELDRERNGRPIVADFKVDHDDVHRDCGGETGFLQPVFSQLYPDRPSGDISYMKIGVNLAFESLSDNGDEALRSLGEDPLEQVLHLLPEYQKPFAHRDWRIAQSTEAYLQPIFAPLVTIKVKPVLDARTLAVAVGRGLAPGRPQELPREATWTIVIDGKKQIIRQRGCQKGTYVTRVDTYPPALFIRANEEAEPEIWKNTPDRFYANTPSAGLVARLDRRTVRYTLSMVVVKPDSQEGPKSEVESSPDPPDLSWRVYTHDFQEPRISAITNDMPPCSVKVTQADVPGQSDLISMPIGFHIHMAVYSRASGGAEMPTEQMSDDEEEEIPDDSSERMETRQTRASGKPTPRKRPAPGSTQGTDSVPNKRQKLPRLSKATKSKNDDYEQDDSVDQDDEEEEAESSSWHPASGDDS